jgi:hypothetical protein
MTHHMTIKTRTTSGRRTRAGLWPDAAVAAAVGVVVGVVVLSGCGGGNNAVQEPAVTVTTTPTVTVTLARPSPTVAATTTGNPKSEVVGRRFDLGTIVRVEDEGGVPVIIFNRWSARDVPDSRLAAKGLTLRVHSDAPYEDRNDKVTYRIPVAPGATFTYAHCVDIDKPAERESSTLKEFTRLQDPENLVLLTLDRQGRATRARNDPAC